MPPLQRTAPPSSPSTAAGESCNRCGEETGVQEGNPNRSQPVLESASCGAAPASINNRSMEHGENSEKDEDRSRNEVDNSAMEDYWNMPGIESIDAVKDGPTANSMGVHLPKSLQLTLDDELWTDLIQLVEEDPLICRIRVTTILQGERVLCLPLHAVAARKRNVPVNVLECLVTAYPSALTVQEARGGRSPLHLALLRPEATLSVIKLLSQTSGTQRIMLLPDSVGNYPLHLAVQYSSADIIRLLFNMDPSVCRKQNDKDQTPLHLISARDPSLPSENVMIPLDLMQEILQAFPEATRRLDRQGRTPLHVACDQPIPRWDYLELIISAYPAALVQKDKTRQTPLQLMKRWVASGSLLPRSAVGLRWLPQPMPPHHDNDVVLAYVQERTNKEKRKVRSLLDKLFTIKITDQRLQKRRELEWQNCYG